MLILYFASGTPRPQTYYRWTSPGRIWGLPSPRYPCAAQPRELPAL